MAGGPHSGEGRRLQADPRAEAQAVASQIVTPEAAHAAERYKHIHDYGIIGDLHTIALVGIDGSIDWFCYPHFDSPSVFAALLDCERGGRFQVVAPAYESRRQLYFPDTNVLITRFLSPQGVGEVTDFMPIEEDGAVEGRHRIVRQVTAVRGQVSFELACQPAFDYARKAHEVEMGPAGALFRGPELLALGAEVPLEARGGAIRSAFELRERESTTIVLQGVASSEAWDEALLGPEEARDLLRDTVAYWRHWASRSTYRGRWREMVNRSALALKLLTFRPSGAIVAAPTTSLPEEVGGTRNWDYRYSWIRDAAFTVYAFLRLGFREEARTFMGWLFDRTKELEPDGSMRPVYGIDGRRDLPEEILDHLEGHRGSRPVRIGNAASNQFQLDIYGALMDAVYLYNKYVTPISYDLWANLRRILNWLCDHWRTPDMGIWEVRSGPQQFVYSNMMCWVALDRGIRLAEKRGFPADILRWRKTRDEIYEQVMNEGWNEDRQAFVQHYGSEALDASTLLMPLVFFLSPTDPRMLKTLDAIQRDLSSDNLVHRYSLEHTRDGLEGQEGTFSLCTFWLVEALTRAGRLEDARFIFEKMLGYANRLGLFAEEIGPTGEALGNFPQAFTHFALISAAFNLDRALGARD